MGPVGLSGYSEHLGHRQGHKVINLGAVWKDAFGESRYAKYEVSISYSSKAIAKVKVDNRQTGKQKDRTKNMPLIIWCGGIKIYKTTRIIISFNHVF